MGSIVLDGSVIEDNVLVGAGSLVSPGKVLQSGFLYLGSPVKQIRALTEQESTLHRFKKFMLVTDFVSNTLLSL